MSKRTKKNTPKCDCYLFSLKPQHNYCKFSQTISVSFCDSSKHRRQKQSTELDEKECLDCPVFNRDNNFATPTFILHSEKQHFELQGEKMRTQHDKKMIEYTDEKDSLNLPKPRSKNSFCNVCRQTYEDYLSHIQGDNHKKCIKNSNFNRFILQLVDKFNPSQKSSLNFNQNTHSTQDDDDVEILQFKPIKKVKPVEQGYERPYQPTIINQILPPPHLNLGHATYFPNHYQGFMPNQYYNYIYPFNQFPTVEINFNNQPLLQSQINYSYQNQNFNFVNQWSNQMAQYQRNMMRFQPINQQYPVMGQNYPQFNGLMSNAQNEAVRNGPQNLRSIQQKVVNYHQNGLGESRIWEQDRMRQNQLNQLQNVGQLNLYQNGRR